MYLLKHFYLHLICYNTSFTTMLDSVFFSVSLDIIIFLDSMIYIAVNYQAVLTAEIALLGERPWFRSGEFA